MDSELFKGITYRSNFELQYNHLTPVKQDSPVVKKFITGLTSQKLPEYFRGTITNNGEREVNGIQAH